MAHALDRTCGRASFLRRDTERPLTLRSEASKLPPMLRRLLPILAILAWLVPNLAEAQYKNGQVGVEGGYMFIGEDSGLEEHGILFSLRGAYKGTDRWWFSARAGLSFRGEQSTLSNQTVILFHLVPVDARYYFATDRFRPFVGVTNCGEKLIASEIVIGRILPEKTRTEVVVRFREVGVHPQGVLEVLSRLVQVVMTMQLHHPQAVMGVFKVGTVLE